MSAGEKPSYIALHASGYTPGSIGYMDHPDRRVGAQVESILNEYAAEGYVLDQLAPLQGADSERILVVMKLVQ